MTIERDARALRELRNISHRIANRIAGLWFDKRGIDISHLIRELAEEASGGIGVAFAENGIPLSALIGGEIPRDALRAGFKSAQALLRKMGGCDGSLIAWDDAMQLADDPAKDTLHALHDLILLREKRAAVIAKARRMIAAARAFHRVNPSRKRDAALRADLRNIRRATAYMIRHVLSDSARTFQFAFPLTWKESEKTKIDSARISFDATRKRVSLGTLAMH